MSLRQLLGAFGHGQGAAPAKELDLVAYYY